MLFFGIVYIPDPRVEVAVANIIIPTDSRFDVSVFGIDPFLDVAVLAVDRILPDALLLLLLLFLKVYMSKSPSFRCGCCRWSLTHQGGRQGQLVLSASHAAAPRRLDSSSSSSCSSTQGQ